MKLGFLASHGGSNMQAIVDACQQGKLAAEPVLVISNNGNSGALSRARNSGIPYRHLSRVTHPGPGELDQKIVDSFREAGVDVVVLAGYMKQLEQRLLAAYAGAILNIHPSLLPKFGGPGMYGQRVHEAVLAAGETESGATVHLVEEEYDTGPVLGQRRVAVEPADTVESLAARVLEQEHLLYPEVLAKIASGELRIPGYWAG